jgi:hypothetical protein
MTTTSWRGVPKSGCATAHNEQTHYRLLQCGIRSGVCPLWVISDLTPSSGHVRFAPKADINRRERACPFWSAPLIVDSFRRRF